MNEEEQQPTMQSTMIDDPIADTEQEEIAEAKEDDDNPSGGGARWWNFNIEKENLRYKIEALLRDSFAFATATSLAVFGIGVVVPASMGQILPFLTAALAFIFPTLEFSVLGLHPGIIGYWFILSVFITVLLAAAAVSNGLFVAVYAMLVFFFMGTFFDSFRTGVNPLVLVLPGFISGHIGKSFSCHEVMRAVGTFIL